MNNIVIDIEIEEQEEGTFLATSKDLPGLLAEGRTHAETIEIAQDVARKLIESYIEHSDPLPAKIMKQIQSKSKRIKKYKIPLSLPV